MLMCWVSASGSHYGQEDRKGYHCLELDKWEVWHEAEKCVESQHTVAGFRARQKHYLSLLIIATIHCTFKFQALCEVC